MSATTLEHQPWRRTPVTMVVLALVGIVVMAIVGGCGPGGSEDGDAAVPDRLVLGINPSYQEEELPEQADALADLLADELGIPVEAHVTATYVGVVEAMAAGTVDIGMMGAMNYVQAHDEYGVEVLLTVVRNGVAFYHAQLITRADSEINELEDVRGRTVAFGDVASTSGYLYPATMLQVAGIDPDSDVNPIFLGAHDHVVTAVLAGDADAGATFEDAHILLFEDEFPDIDERIRKVALSDPIPYDTVSVRAGLDPDFKEAIADAFLAIAESAEGRQVLAELFFIDGFVRSTDADYAPVREVLQHMDVDPEE